MKVARPRLDAVRWVDLATARDERGALTSIEAGRETPFEIKRVFYMHDVVSQRGGHAHMDTDQVVIAVSGRLEIELRDGTASMRYVLNEPTRGLYIPRMVFIDIHDMPPTSVCLVIANTHYDPTRSFRSWDDYLEAQNGSSAPAEPAAEVGELRHDRGSR